jgi:hypothetical protein
MTSYLPGKWIFAEGPWNGAYIYFNLSVKTLRTSLIWLTSLLPWHKITLLMQCVESVTDVLFADIFVISDAVPIICFLIDTAL